VQVPSAVGSGLVWLTGSSLSMMIGLVGLSMAIIQMLPLVTLAVPAPLAAIGVVTALAIALPIDVRTVGDVARIAGGFPEFSIPSVPLSLHTLGTTLSSQYLLTTSVSRCNICGWIVGERLTD
jgi:SulP family sulfate permease